MYIINLEYKDKRRDLYSFLLENLFSATDTEDLCFCRYSPQLTRDQLRVDLWSKELKTEMFTLVSECVHVCVWLFVFPLSKVLVSLKVGAGSDAASAAV